MVKVRTCFDDIHDFQEFFNSSKAVGHIFWYGRYRDEGKRVYYRYFYFSDAETAHTFKKVFRLSA